MPSPRELKQVADHYGIPWPAFDDMLKNFRGAFGPKGLSKMISVAGQARAAGVDIQSAWDDALQPEAEGRRLQTGGTDNLLRPPASSLQSGAT